MQVQQSFSASTTAAVFESSSGGTHFICVVNPGLIPTSFREEFVSAGCHRDQSIARLPAFQGLKSLVRLITPAGMGVRALKMYRRTCNEQTCAEWLVLALNVEDIA